MPYEFEWEEIKSHPEYKETTPETRTQMRSDYFTGVMAKDPAYQEFDENTKKQSYDDWMGGHVDPVTEKQQPERTILGTAKDIGITVGRGVIQAPEAVQGLFDIATGGRVGKFTSEHLGYKPKEAQDILSSYYSPAQKYAKEQVHKAKGFKGTIRESLAYPSTIATAGAESIPSMGMGAVKGAQVLKYAPALARKLGKYAPLVAGAIGEGLISAGSTAEDIRSQTDDGLLTLKQSGISTLSGLGTTAFGVAGGRLAAKLGFDDIDTFLTRVASETGEEVAKKPLNVVARVVGGGISEGAFEEMPQSMQEQVWMNAATDKPLLEGVEEAGATGLLVGAAMGGAFGLRRGQQAVAPEEPESFDINQIAPFLEQLSRVETEEDRASIINEVIQNPNTTEQAKIGLVESGVLEAHGIERPVMATGDVLSSLDHIFAPKQEIGADLPTEEYQAESIMDEFAVQAEQELAQTRTPEMVAQANADLHNSAMNKLQKRQDLTSEESTYIDEYHQSIKETEQQRVEAKKKADAVLAYAQEKADLETATDEYTPTPVPSAKETEAEILAGMHDETISGAAQEVERDLRHKVAEPVGEVEPLTTLSPEAAIARQEYAKTEIPQETVDLALKQSEEIARENPVYKAVQDARVGGRINLSTLSKDYDREGLAKKYPAMFSYNGRLNIDEFASEQGFESGDAFVEQLKSTPSMKTEIKKISDSILEEQLQGAEQEAEYNIAERIKKADKKIDAVIDIVSGVTNLKDLDTVSEQFKTEQAKHPELAMKGARRRINKAIRDQRTELKQEVKQIGEQREEEIQPKVVPVDVVDGQNGQLPEKVKIDGEQKAKKAEVEEKPEEAKMPGKGEAPVERQEGIESWIADNNIVVSTGLKEIASMMWESGQIEAAKGLVAPQQTLKEQTKATRKRNYKKDKKVVAESDKIITVIGRMLPEGENVRFEGVDDGLYYYTPFGGFWDELVRADDSMSAKQTTLAVKAHTVRALDRKIKAKRKEYQDAEQNKAGDEKGNGDATGDLRPRHVQKDVEQKPTKLRGKKERRKDDEGQEALDGRKRKPGRLTEKWLLSDRNNINEKIEEIFGTPESLDRQESGEMTETPMLQLANDYQEDLRFASHEGDTATVKSILKAVRDGELLDKKSDISTEERDVQPSPDILSKRKSRQYRLSRKDSFLKSTITGQDGRAYMIEDLVNQVYKAGQSLAQFTQKLKQKLGKDFEQIKAKVKSLYETLSQPLRGEVGAVGKDVKFSKTDVEPKLSALHNLTEDNLIFADKMGGMPVPSIAVVKEGMGVEGYGGITLIGTKDLADPAIQPVFDADAYTATFPSPEYKKLTAKNSRELNNFFDGYFQYSNVPTAPLYEMDTAGDRGDKGKVVEVLRRSNMAKVRFLKEIHGENTRRPMMDEPLSRVGKISQHSKVREFFRENKRINYDDTAKIAELSDVVRKSIPATYSGKLADLFFDQVFDEDGVIHFTHMNQMQNDQMYLGKKKLNSQKLQDTLAKKIKGKEAEFDTWIAEQIDPLFGEPYLKIGRTKKPYNLESITEQMVSQRNRGAEETMTFGEGNARAMASQRFDTIHWMRNASYQIKRGEELSKARDEAKEAASEFRSAVLPYYKYSDTWDALDSSMKAIAQFAKGGGGRKQISSFLSRNNFTNVPSHVLDLGIDAKEKMINAPVPYFESKPQRAVDLGEFAGAVIPKGTSKEIKAILDKHDVPYRVYGKAYDEEARTATVDKFRKTLQRKGKETLFQKAAQPLPPIQQADLQQEVPQGLTKSGKVVIETPEQFAIKYPDEKGRTEGYVGKDGTVHLIQGNVRKGEAMNVLAHEFVHAKKLGFKDSKQFKSILTMLEKRAKGKTTEAKAIQGAIARIPEDTLPEHRAEETLAYLVTNSPKISIVKQYIARVKKFLVEHGFNENMLKNIDLQALALSVVQREAKVDKADGVRGLSPVMASKGPEAKQWYSRLQNLVKDFDVKKQPATAWISTSFRDDVAMGGVPLFSKAKTETAWEKAQRTKVDKTLTKDQMEAIIRGGFGKRPAKKTVKQRIDTASVRTGVKLRQGLVDQFASLKQILNNDQAWMMAHLTKSDTGVLMSAIKNGTPYLEKSGAISLKENSDSLHDVLDPLGNEADRFFQWIAGHRAERLATEDRENLFKTEDIKALKTLDQGTMEDGKDREKTYKEALNRFEAMGAAINQIGVDTGLISSEEAKRWENEGWYVPFYRMLEKEGSKGPRNIGNLTNQAAYKELKGGESQLDDILTNVLLNWNHVISASLRNQAGVKALDSAVDMGLAEIVPREIKGKDAVYVRKDGQEVWYDILGGKNGQDGPLVLDSLMALNYEGMNNLGMKILRGFKRTLTQGVTASPGFKIRNLIRDTIHASAVTSASPYMWKNVKTGWNYDTELMEAGGGAFTQEGYIHGSDPDALKSLVEGESVVNTTSALKKVWKRYEDFGAQLENVNRVAGFEEDLKKGKTLLEANFNARDQLDFSRTGSFPAIRFIAQTVPFFNARLQGLDKLGRSAIDKDQQKQFAAVAGSYALASVMLGLAMAGDSDYDEVEEWEKRTYHLFKVPGSNMMYRIPRPFEVGAIAYMAEKMTDQFLKDNSEITDLRDALWHTLSDTFAFNPIPQAFKPLVEVYANKSMFTGRSIESQGMQRLSKPERFQPWTSKTAKGVSAAMAKTLPESAVLSPVQLQHMVRAYTGWLGANILAGVDGTVKIVSGEVTPQTKWYEYEPMKALVREAEAKSTKFTSQFYKNMNELNQSLADIGKYRGTKKGSEIAKRTAGVARHKRRYRKTAQQLTNLRKQIRTIYDDKRLSSVSKRTQIKNLNKRMNELTKRVVTETDKPF